MRHLVQALTIAFGVAALAGCQPGEDAGVQRTSAVTSPSASAFPSSSVAPGTTAAPAVPSSPPVADAPAPPPASPELQNDRVLTAAVMIVSAGDVGAAIEQGSFTSAELDAAFAAIETGTLTHYTD